MQENLFMPEGTEGKRAREDKHRMIQQRLRQIGDGSFGQRYEKGKETNSLRRLKKAPEHFVLFEGN